MKYVILLFMFLSVSVYAQLDSLDRIELKNSKILSGKVVKITSQTVEFREAVTNLLYEYQKSEIRDLKLSNGTILSFSDSGEQQGNVTGSMTNTQTNTRNTTPPSSGTTGTNVTSSGNTNTTTTGTTTDNTGGQKTDTNRQGQQQADNTQQQGLSTTALVLLGAAGVIVLLLLGKAIF